MNLLHHRFLLAHDFALINPLQVDSALWSDLPTVPLAHTAIDSGRHLLPRLLELRSLGDALCADLLERSAHHDRSSRHPYVSALIRSASNVQDLGSWLSRQLLITGPDRSPALLRYYDPRVFRHLRWLLSDAQLGFLLGSVEAWSWRDGSGNWQSQYRGRHSPLPSLRLHAGQWDSLQRLGLLNESLRQIARIAPAIELGDDLARRTDALLASAYREHGLADPVDRRLFAVQAIVFHPRIHSHPQLARRLASARDGTGSYAAACGDLDDPTLRSFASELAPPSRMLA